MASERLISLNQALGDGIERLRRPIWANRMDHIKLDLYPGGSHGPWIHLYAPFNLWCNGRDPVDLLWMDVGDCDAEEWIPYEGPLPDSVDYKTAVRSYEAPDGE